MSAGNCRAPRQNGWSDREERGWGWHATLDRRPREHLDGVVQRGATTAGRQEGSCHRVGSVAARRRDNQGDTTDGPTHLERDITAGRRALCHPAATVSQADAPYRAQ